MHNPQEILSATIYTWLGGVPDYSEILEYAKRFPNEKKGLFTQSVDSTFGRIMREKERFFLESGCPGFVSQIPEHRQLNYVYCIALYNALSIERDIKEKYPKALQNPLPATFREWAKRYAEVWDRALALATAEEYLIRSVYARSLLLVVPDVLRIDSLLGQLSDSLKRNGERLKGGEAISQSEIEEDLSLLGSFPFLPEEYRIRIVRQANIMEKVALYEHLLSLLSVLREYGVQEASSNFPEFQKAIWEQLKIFCENEQLEIFEGRRLAGAPEFDEVERLFHSFNRIWTVENIREEAVADPTLELRATLTGKTQERFFELFTRFIDGSLIAQVICEPESSGIIASNIEASRSWLDISEEFRRPNGDALAHDTRMKFVRSVWKVYHNTVQSDKSSVLGKSPA